MVWAIIFNPDPVRLLVSHVLNLNLIQGVGFCIVSYISLHISRSSLVRWDLSRQYSFLLSYIYARLCIMVATRFKTYQSSASSSTHYPSTTGVFYSMAPSAPKTATTTKGKCYKGIPTRH